MHASPATFPAALHDLDGQRIAGTSLAIALHVAVAMVLLMPVQRAAAPAPDEPPLILSVLPHFVPPQPPPPTHAPTTPTVRPMPTPPIAPIAPPDNDVTPTKDGTEPYFPPQTIIDTQPPGLSFVDLRADVSPAPIYPGRAISRDQEGRVVLRVLVDEQGRPAEVAIERSSGFRLLDEAALKIVRSHWHFVPAQRAGAAVSAWALVPIVFQLER